MAQKYVERRMEKVLKRAARQFPSLILTGPRQSGKTTILKHLFSKTHRYVSLDDPDTRLMANQDAKYFLKNYPPPVIIDEMQYAPNLFPLIKIAIDHARSRKGLFLLTGSQIFPLMAGVTESLAGRIAVLSLLSFSFKELFSGRKLPDLNMIKNYALRGGYPDVALGRKIDMRLWFGGYLQTYLERDVRQIRQIGDLTDFQRFLEMLAALNGQMLNFSNLSSDLGIAVNTIKSWISILEATHQVVLIKPYFKNRGKRLMKSPRIYFLDLGFVNYLTGITTKEQVFKGPAAGALFEAMILGELLRDAHTQGEVPRIYGWRTSHGKEVDFIVEKGGKLIPIEVKLGTAQNKSAAKHLIAFSEIFSEEVRTSYLINLADHRVSLGKRVVGLPAFKFFSQTNF
jgi:uncharacterized protein